MLENNSVSRPSKLSRSLLKVLRCPSCSDELRIVEPEPFPDKDLNSRLVCRCGRAYPIRYGVPRFVDSDQYAQSFSFEWQIHRQTQFDSRTQGSSTRRFIEVTGIAPRELRGKKVLDAGVGTGRFAEVISAAGAEVVGIDLSYAIDVARENIGNIEGVDLVQGDICTPPLKTESFDFIYSIGVLHHTPDAAASFRSLVRLLKPGGTIAIYVYPRYGIAWRISDFYRVLTRRLPHRLLYFFCYFSIPMYYLKKLPLIGSVLRVLIPTSPHPNWRWRVLDTFDWYSPRFQSKHTYPEVYRWFQHNGLIKIEIMESPICLRGQKPI